MDPKKLHPELNAFNCPGGLFDVEPCELDLDVGRFGRVKDPNKRQGTIYKERFEVVGVQKDYRGRVIYRVVFESDIHRFGTPLPPDEVILEE